MPARTFHAVDPRSGEAGAQYTEATPEDVHETVAAAAAAFAAPSLRDDGRRAEMPGEAAARLRGAEEEIVAVCQAETGLPEARVRSELERTWRQLEAFAALVEAGDYVDAIIDLPDPDARPIPRPDVRRMLVPIGPVAVFGASNFPLAFSTAGGDSASALAAGCPVVVKGHPAHPGTSELVGQALQAAVSSSGLPEGVFSLLLGEIETGSALVADPRIKAVGFTGSRGGGLAIARIAAARPEPIPVYAEMSSINPVYLLPAALSARADALGREFVASLTMGAGQFCTNPGLVFGIEGRDLDRFLDAAATAL